MVEPTCSSKPRRAGAIAAGLGAIGVCASCCLLPALALAVGAGGAWLSVFDKLAAYKWLFVILAAGLIGWGFYAVYGRPRSCGKDCGCRPGVTIKVALWLAVLGAAASVLFDAIEPSLS